MEFSTLHFDIYYIAFGILSIIRHNTTKQLRERGSKCESRGVTMHKQEGEYAKKTNY